MSATIVVFAWGAGVARAGSTYPLCEAGPGKPVVSPQNSGSCASGQREIVLASGAALKKLQTEAATDKRLQKEVTTLETTLSKVSYHPNGLYGPPTLRISDANLQIVSDTGHTAATPNGLGNIIIGYDEHAGTQTGGRAGLPPSPLDDTRGEELQ